MTNKMTFYESISCMDKDEIVKFWVSEAEKSQKVAQHLFAKKDYSYALFFGHLAIEKLLKSIHAKVVDENVPRTHNLPRIAKAARLIIPNRCPLIRAALSRLIPWSVK